MYGTTAFEILWEHEFNAKRTGFSTKLGVTSDVLQPRQTSRDVNVKVNPTAARNVARYLERNCPLPEVHEICALLKIVAATACAVYPREQLAE